LEDQSDACELKKYLHQKKKKIGEGPGAIMGKSEKEPLFPTGKFVRKR